MANNKSAFLLVLLRGLNEIIPSIHIVNMLAMLVAVIESALRKMLRQALLIFKVFLFFCFLLDNFNSLIPRVPMPMYYIPHNHHHPVVQ